MEFACCDLVLVLGLKEGSRVVAVDLEGVAGALRALS